MSRFFDKLRRPDWEHPDDFGEGADVEWSDATALGSEYEQQFALNRDLWRHRHIPTCGPWREGPSPDLARGDKA